MIFAPESRYSSGSVQAALPATEQPVSGAPSTRAALTTLLLEAGDASAQSLAARMLAQSGVFEALEPKIRDLGFET